MASTVASGLFDALEFAGAEFLFKWNNVLRSRSGET